MSLHGEAIKSMRLSGSDASMIKGTCNFLARLKMKSRLSGRAEILELGVNRYPLNAKTFLESISL